MSKSERRYEAFLPHLHSRIDLPFFLRQLVISGERIVRKFVD